LEDLGQAAEAAETEPFRKFRRENPMADMRTAAERRARDQDAWHRAVRPRHSVGEDCLLAASRDDDDDDPGDFGNFELPTDEALVAGGEHFVHVAFDIRGPYEVSSFRRDPAAFIASAARKSRVEVSLRRCTP